MLSNHNENGENGINTPSSSTDVQPTPSTKHRAFFGLQCFGWGMFILLNLFSRQYFVHFHLGELVNSVTIGVSLFAVSSLLRHYYRSRFNLSHIGQCFFHIVLGTSIGTLVSLLLYAGVILPNQTLLYGHPVAGIWQQLIFGSPVVFLLLFLWSSIYLVFKKQWALKRAKGQQQKLDESLKAARLDVLLSQLNPHFLFNAINNIRALTLEDSHRARDMLASLSEVMRYTMQIDKATLIYFEQELAMVEHFVALNKLQFEHKLIVEYDIQATTRQRKLPPMILQLLVENALKHGIGKRRQGGKIKISTVESTDSWTLLIENSGELMPTSQQNSGIGIKNIQQRLALVYADSAKFNLSSKGDEVIARVTLPKEPSII